MTYVDIWEMFALVKDEYMYWKNIGIDLNQAH
jgi:hypothetical protein